MNSFVKAGLSTAFGAALLLGGAGVSFADDGPGAVASGYVHNSPGVLSGNLIQIPVDIPVNVCGNSVNGIAGLNPAFGNSCVDH